MNGLVSEPVNHSAGEETQKTWDQIIELSFAAPGGASARSVPGKSHTDTEYQPANDVSDNISGRHCGEGDQPQPAHHI